MFAYTSTPAPLRARLLAGCALAAASLGTQASAQRAFQAVPTDTINATVNQNTGIDVVTVTAPQALIDWTPVDNAGTGTINILAAGDELRFQVDNADSLPRYTVLNRINAADPSRAVRIDGIVNSLVDTGSGVSDGSIWFYSPGGIILGGTSRFDVGSLVLTANAIQIGNLDDEGLFAGQDTNAVAGTIQFRGSADSKSFVTIETGAKINAAGNYVALVAPRVAQRGAITVNGSAALIAAESADVTIPVEGNLFDIAVFGGSKVDTAGEVTLDHSGTTEISDPQQNENSRRIYLVAVPKNDAITMLVSGTAGYEAAAQVSAINGRVVLLAATDPSISPDNINFASGLDANIKISGFSTNTQAQAIGTAFDLDATKSSSTFGRDLFVGPGSTATVKVANGFSLDIGKDTDGVARFEADRTDISVSSGGSLNVGSSLLVRSQIGFSVSARAAGTPVSLLVDNGTVTIGGDLSLRSRAIGSFGDAAEDAGGGQVTAAVRNNGLIDVSGLLELTSEGLGGDAGYGVAGPGMGGAASLTAETGGRITAADVGIFSRGFGGFGGQAGTGQGGDASLTINGGFVNAVTAVVIESRGEGGSSPALEGAAGAGVGGTATLNMAGGELTAGTTISLAATGTGGFENGYGEVVGGAGAGGAIAFTASAGGIITAPSLNFDASGKGQDGTLGGGAGTGGDVTVSLTGGVKLDTGLVSLNLNGAGGRGGSADEADGGRGAGGNAVVTSTASTIRFDQLTINAIGQGGTAFENAGGSGQGGSALVTLTSSTAPGANAISIDVTGVGGEGNNSGGGGAGGQASFTVAGTSLVSSGDIALQATGAGDFGNVGGGFGKGGRIDLVAQGGTIQASNIIADASGSGEQAFSAGLAGDGEGGVINITSGATGLIKGLSVVRADGTGGDADGSANPGAGTGGVVTVRADSGTIDSVGATLRFYADGIGGNSEFVGVTAPLARGGSVDLAVSGTGQLLVSSLLAQADGGFDDQPEGPILNHGGRGVGGTAKLSVSGGTVTGDDLTFSATGRGAVSGSGGAGGAAFQGRAELAVSGGSITASTLSVTALALGGDGFDQQGESGIDAGSGGTAGIGASPFVGEGGAIVSVTGGSLSVSVATVDGSSSGGLGGEGEEFAETPATRSGGDAVGGVAVFTASGTGSISLGSLSVTATGTGGDGGSVLLFDSSSTDSNGGKGGSGTGGLVSVTLGGTGAQSPSALFATAGGVGGAGGDVRPFFSEGSVSGSGRGGDGGAANGGGANVNIDGSVDGFAFISARAEAQGGVGGQGPQGGSGGDAEAGSATIAVAGGESFFAGLQVFSDATGGNGANGLGGNAGSGGAARGLNATLTIGATANVSTGQLQLSATGQGGQGGRGADDVGAGFSGGNGGFAAGGTAAITVNGGRLELPGGSETPPASLIAIASAGDGGDGGSASEGTAGAGGSGGNAIGGTAQITSIGGALNLFATNMDADAIGGARGQPGAGIEGVVGSLGFGQGGSIKIDAQQGGAPTNRVLLGFAQLTADASSRFEEIAPSGAGSIAIKAAGSNSAGALAFDLLDASALGSLIPEDRPSLIKISGTGAPITVNGSAELFATGAITFDFSGNSGLRAGGDLIADSRDSILVSHGGQAPGGSFASLAGNDVELIAGFEVAALATTRINSQNQLSLTSGASTTIGSARVGGSLEIRASDDVTVAAGAQIVVDRSITVLSGDDIVIDSGALLRAANNAPPESGYGASDPLQQQTQLKLYAGALFFGEGGVPGDIRSLIINGDVQSPSRTMQLEANAIQAADGTTVSGGNLYLRTLGTAPATPSDDFGQLTAPCLQGSACLGNVEFTGSVVIGQSGFAPTNLRISGNLTGATVSAGATNTVRLGRDGFASTIAATNTLTLDARDGDLLGVGTIAMTGGAGLTSLYAGRDLSAAGLDVTAPGGLDLVSGRDVILGDIDSPLIRTRDQDLAIVNPGGITATGLIDLGGVTTSTDLLLDSGISVTVGNVMLASDKTLSVFSDGAATLGQALAGSITIGALGTITAGTLTASTGDMVLRSDEGDIAVDALSSVGQTALRADLGAITVSSDADAEGGIDALAESIALTGANGLNVTAAKATAGDVRLTTTSGILSGGDLLASAAIRLVGAGDIAFSGATATTLVSAIASGAITGDSVSVDSGPANLSGSAGVTIGFLAGQSGTLTSSGGAIRVASVGSVPGGITAIGRSVELTGSGDLKIAVATATGGDVLLSAPNGTVTADTVTSSGGVTAGGRAVTIDRLSTDGAAKLTATAGDVTVLTDAVTTGGLTATGEFVTVSGLTGLNIAQATATKGDISLTSKGDIAFATLSAADAAVLSAAGKVTGGDAGTGNRLDITAPGGITLNSFSSGGPTSLSASNGAILVKTDASGSSLEATAQSIDISSQFDLTVALAQATKGDLSLSAAGAISAALLQASGNATITANDGVTIASLVTGGNASLTAAGGAIEVTDAASGGVTATGLSVNLGSSGDLNVVSALATVGDVVLSAAGDLQAGSAEATNGAVTLTGNAAIGFGNLVAGTLVDISAQGDITGGSARAPRIRISAPGDVNLAGTLDAFSPESGAEGVIDVQADGAIDVRSGAQLLSDQAMTLIAGNDVRIGNGATLRAARGVTSSSLPPLSQPGQLSIQAGLASVPRAPGNVATIVAGAGAAIAGRTVVLNAEAVQLDALSQVGAANLFVRIGNAPSLSGPFSDDGGVLSAACVQGNACLGGVAVSGRLQIGEAGFLPNRISLSGAVSAAEVLLRGRDTLSITNNLTGSTRLALESISGDIAVASGATLNTSGGPLSLVAGRDILADGSSVIGTGEVGLSAGRDAVFGTLAAGTLRGADSDGVRADLASLSGVRNLSVTKSVTVSGGSIELAALGNLDVAQANAPLSGLTRLSAEGLARLGTGSGTVFLTGADVRLGTFAGDAVTLSGGSIEIGTASATGLVQADGDAITFGTVNAQTVDLVALGEINGQTLAGGAIKVDGADGVTVNFVRSSTAQLNAVNGAVSVAGDTAVTDGVVALGKSVTLVGQDGLTVLSATATGADVTLSAGGGLLDAGTSSATGMMKLDAAGAVGFDMLKAGTLTISAKGDINGGSATAGSIAISTPGALVANDLVATAGTLSVVADKGVTLDTAASFGTTTLKAAKGDVTVASDIRPGEGLIVSAPTIDLTARNGLLIAEATATAGDLKLTTIAGDLVAGRSTAAGGIALDSAGAISFTSLAAQQAISLKASGSVTGGAIVATSGAVSVTGAQGIDLGSIAAGGPVTLGASAGTILVRTDLTASGPIQATAQALNLTAVNHLIIDQAQAAGGDIVLTSKNGALTIGQASATGGLTANTPGLLSVTGAAAAAGIAFTSKDIAIGAKAQLGSTSQTTALTLTSTADRMFIGDATGAGYRIDTTELARLASKGDISLISAPQNATGLAFSLFDPSATNVVVGALNFDGAQLGSTGTLRIASPRSIGVTGNSQFKNFTGGQTVTLSATGDISLAAEGGLVTVKDSAGGLAGTLRLEANQIHAMSTAKRSEIAGLTLNDARQRLGTNDQVNNQGGYFQAGNIIVRMNRLLIQNSGENGADPTVRRGLTANSLTIFAGQGPAEVVLNGQVNGATGAALRDAVTLNGSFDPSSEFNGCSIGAACGLLTPEPQFDPAPVLSSSRDQVQSEEEEDEKEQALQASQTRPEPIIQFMTAPSSRLDPLIDEPVTGAGNEDFWETPTLPSPGR